MIWTYFFRTTGNVIGLRFRAEPDIILPEDTQWVMVGEPCT